MKHLGNVCDIDGAKIPVVDCITFGAPCQDLSIAGKRAGMKHEDAGDDETTRSGLFFEAIRIIKEMRDKDGADGRPSELVRPRFAVYENVPGAFSSNKGKDFQAVLTELVRIAKADADDVPIPDKGRWPHSGVLEGMGDNGCPFSIAYRVVDAQHWGVPQRRKRICVVADFGGLSASEVLFERKSVCGHTSQSREKRQRTSDPAEGSVDDAGGSIAYGISPYDSSREAISFHERAGKPGGSKGILIQHEHTGALGTVNVQNVMAYEETDTGAE